MRKFLSVLLAMAMVLSLTVTSFAADTAADAKAEMAGKTVILHTNDVHGAVEGYAYIAQLKADYEAKGAEVILVDAGDFSQGTTYVSSTKGADAVTMMNAAGYDVVTLGNHEFDYGYAQLKENMSKAKFKVVCADVFNEDGTPIFDASYTYTTKSGVKVGFFGMETPETQTKANPALIKGLTFADKDAFTKAAADQVAALKDADVVICLAHLGVDAESAPYRSTDLYAAVKGIDFIIDGHSHTVMTKGEKGEPIQSTGTAFKNIGVIVIDDASKKIESNSLYEIKEDTAKDATVAAAAKVIVDRVNNEYGVKFATSKVELNGAKAPNGNRDVETNNGDLITDAMRWKVLQNKDGLTVNEDHVVAITNGGGIRADISAGDITYGQIIKVHPYGNALCVVEATGQEIIDALEWTARNTMATFSDGENAIGEMGGFLQVSGLKYTIDTTVKSSAKGDDKSMFVSVDGAYRVKNVKVLKNGKYVDIDPKATYTVASHNYMLKDSGDGINMFADNKLLQDSVMLDNQVLINYIKDSLGGVVPATYAAPQGRITVIATPYTDVLDGNWAVEAVNYVTDKNFMKGLSETTFGPNGALTRGMLVTVLYRMAGSPAVTGKVSEKFSDCTDGSWYADAVLWASANGIVNGYEDGTYKPTKAINRQEMAKVLYGYDKVGGKNAEGITEKLTYTDVDAIGEWAIESVTYCTAAGYLAGSNGAFNPTGTATRAMGAKVLMNMTKEAA